MSEIKVALYVLRVKNIHFGSSSHPSWTTAAEAKLRYVYSISKPHGHNFKRYVRLILSKAKQSYISILDFKTTWSEFQKPCQTAVMRGEAEL